MNIESSSQSRRKSSQPKCKSNPHKQTKFIPQIQQNLSASQTKFIPHKQILTSKV